jgi:hypothetical protein
MGKKCFPVGDLIEVVGWLFGGEQLFLLSFWGVFLFCLGLVFSALVNNRFVFIGGILSLTLGIFSTLFGFYVAGHYAHQYNNLQKVLEQKY